MKKELLESNFSNITLSDSGINFYLGDVYGGNCFCSNDVDRYKKEVTVVDFLKHRISIEQEQQLLDECLDFFTIVYESHLPIDNSKENQALTFLIVMEHLIKKHYF